MPSVPGWLSWSLRGVCLILGLAVVVVPELPRDWFLAVNPASGELHMITRSHTSRVPLHVLWGLEGFREVPLALRGLVFVALGGLTLVPRAGRVPRPDGLHQPWLGRLGRSRWLAVICGVAAVGVFWLLRVPYARNLDFGDAPGLKNDVEVGMVFAAEVLPYHLFNGVRGLLGLLMERPPGELAIALVSCLCGGLFVGAMVALVQAVAETQTRFLLFCGTGLAGYTVMFCGYVETTQVELAAMALYFALAVRVLRSPAGRERTQRLLLAVAALSLALLAHAASILLLPSVAVLFVAEAARPGMSWPRAVRGALSLRNAALVGVVIVLPYVQVVVRPFFLQGDLGNITGGGDLIMFVPWQFDPAEPVSRYVYYSFLSGWHLAELFSTFLVASPLAVPLCVCAAGLWVSQLGKSRGRAGTPASTAGTEPGRYSGTEPGRYSGTEPGRYSGTEPGRCIGTEPGRCTGVDRWWLGVLGSAAAGCLLVPLLWNHDYGMWGDWNLAACYLFPLNLFAWSLFTSATRQWRTVPGFDRRVVIPLLLVQFVLGAGLLLQLW